MLDISRAHAHASVPHPFPVTCAFCYNTIETCGLNVEYERAESRMDVCKQTDNMSIDEKSDNGNVCFNRESAIHPKLVEKILQWSKNQSQQYI